MERNPIPVIRKRLLANAFLHVCGTGVSLAGCASSSPSPDQPRLTAQQKLEGPLRTPREGVGDDASAAAYTLANRGMGN